jgi:hypothetical protein
MHTFLALSLFCNWLKMNAMKQIKDSTKTTKSTLISVVKKRISTVSLRKDDILEINIEPNEQFEYKDMEELIDAAQLAEGNVF